MVLKLFPIDSSGHSPLANLGGQGLTQLAKIFVDTPVVGSITFPMDGQGL